MTPAETLAQIEQALSSADPLAIIERLRPQTFQHAMTWARRLPLWEDFQGSAQAIAVARLISRRAMKEHQLAFDAEGRVIDESKKSTAKPRTRSFPMQLDEDTIEVRYQPTYMAGTDLFSFIGKKIELPPDAHPIANIVGSHTPHALSGTGWWSHYAPHDAVEAFGGPKQFARMYAEARLEGKDKELDETLQGKRPEMTTTRRTPKEQPIVGQHTAEVVGEQREIAIGDHQGELF